MRSVELDRGWRLPAVQRHHEIATSVAIASLMMCGDGVAIDYLYVANRSLWADVEILLRTIPRVIGRKGP